MASPLFAQIRLNVAPWESIQRSIDAAPETGAEISIAPGIYRERIKITKPRITLRSQSGEAKRTVIVFDDCAGSAGSAFKFAAAAISGDGFTAENLTFANDYNRAPTSKPRRDRRLWHWR
jgi:pectin methylesterase-like acyl-CoA thioesterase